MNLKNALLSLVSLLVMLGLAEAALQIVDYPPAPQAGWRWDQSPYRGDMNASDQQVNQLGLRGSKIEYSEQDFVVVLLGDSQVEAGTQTADKLPEAVLQRALQEKTGQQNIKVFSIASAGWGNDQQLIWLKKYVETYRADLVVNWLTPVNDYWENTFIDRNTTLEAGKLKPSFAVTEADELVDAMPATLDWKLKNLLVLAAARILRGDKYTLEQYQLYAWMKTLPSPVAEGAPKAECPANEIGMNSLVGAYTQGNRAYTLVTEENVGNGRSHFSPFLATNSPRDLYSIKLTHRILAEVEKTAKAHQAQFFLYHPYRHELDAAFREIKCLKSPGGQTWAFDGSDWMRYLKASPLAGQLLTANIEAPHVLTSGPNDWHFNEEGNRLAMQALAAKILERTSLAKSKSKADAKVAGAPAG